MPSYPREKSIFCGEFVTIIRIQCAISPTYLKRKIHTIPTFGDANQRMRNYT
jgi:hypothetical protein